MMAIIVVLLQYNNAVKEKIAREEKMIMRCVAINSCMDLLASQVILSAHDRAHTSNSLE